VNVIADNIDVLSLSGHKIYGPQGGGGAVCSPGATPGADCGADRRRRHERGMRSGTLNVPGIVGLGKACEIAYEEMATEAKFLAGLRDGLKAKLESELDYIPRERVNGT